MNGGIAGDSDAAGYDRRCQGREVTSRRRRTTDHCTIDRAAGDHCTIDRAAGDRCTIDRAAGDHQLGPDNCKLRVYRVYELVEGIDEILGRGLRKKCNWNAHQSPVLVRVFTLARKYSDARPAPSANLYYFHFERQPPAT